MEKPVGGQWEDEEDREVIQTEERVCAGRPDGNTNVALWRDFETTMRYH